MCKITRNKFFDKAKNVIVNFEAGTFRDPPPVNGESSGWDVMLK